MVEGEGPVGRKIAQKPHRRQAQGGKRKAENPPRRGGELSVPAVPTSQANVGGVFAIFEASQEVEWDAWKSGFGSMFAGIGTLGRFAEWGWNNGMSECWNHGETVQEFH